MMKNNKTYSPTEDQQKVLKNKFSKSIVSASAGTGKTATIIEYIANLIQQGHGINRMLVVTFTNNAANEMKDRLLEKLMQMPSSPYILDQIDEIFVSNISTIHAFLQKIIKQNIDKLLISEDFALLNESKSEEIKDRAYEEAFNVICSDEKFEKLILSTRKEDGFLRDVVKKLDSHFSVQANPEERLNYYRQNQDKIFKECEKYLNDNLVNSFYAYANKASKILENLKDGDKNLNYLKNYITQLQRVASENSFKENVEQISSMQFGKIATSKIEKDFESLRESVKKKITEVKKWDLNQEENWIPNDLVLDVYDFYNVYKNKIQKIKQEENVLDFDDLEKYAEFILQDEKIAEDISKNFDYVFVDEYQDTNPVQEKLVKLLSKHANFMAVGDPKQGIYGFRNATSEIMKKDIADLKEEGVYYLKSNFRSDKRILNFVNKVFANVMFEKNTGIDYVSTSMFDGRTDFVEEKLPAVRIDAIKEVETKEEAPKVKLYDIFNDKLVTEKKNLFEAEVISERIKQMLLTKIYDPKLKVERNVNYSDITILLRGRGGLLDKLLEVFALNKIPVLSTIEKNISDSEEIDVLKNFLKLCVDIKDDVALTSVMLSRLMQVDINTVANLRLEDKQKSLYEAIKENEEFKFVFEIIEKFKLNVFSKGVKFAFEKLFAKSDYYSYLLSKEDGLNEKSQVEKFLDVVASSGYDYDIPSLLKYLESEDIRVSNEGSGVNAVTITTIHASKGLEYPIVVLAGMGGEISRRSASRFAVNNEFGLGFNYYDFEKNIKCRNIVLSAILQSKKKKEFIDEIMLLYVAMTRAKNHLYITGEFDKDFVDINMPDDVFETKTYLQLVLSAIKNDYDVEKGDNKNGVEINFVDEIENYEKTSDVKISTSDLNLVKEIKDYLNYDYKFTPATKQRFKNSVTSLNEREESLKSVVGGSENIDIGNAYHKALEILDFEKVNTKEDIINGLKDFSEIDLIDKDILLNNILLIKSKVNGLKVFKEKQFTMKLNLKEIDKNSFDEDIMIQGVVDLFAIGEKNVLIDYKFTNIHDDKRLIDKYKKQLLLYKLAIEKAFKIKLNEIYLLSLKYGEIIKIN